MKYLLDTDVISQYTKDRPDPRVDAWMESVPVRDLYLSIITLAELAQGVEMLPVGARRKRLELWLNNDLEARFLGRTLSIEAETVRHFGRLMARASRKGYTPGGFDGLIAATASANGMVVATLNRKHFERLGVDLVQW